MKTPTIYRLRPGRVTLYLGLIAGVLAVVHIVAMQIIFNDDLGLADPPSTPAGPWVSSTSPAVR